MLLFLGFFMGPHFIMILFITKTNKLGYILFSPLPSSTLLGHINLSLYPFSVSNTTLWVVLDCSQVQLVAKQEVRIP